MSNFRRVLQTAEMNTETLVVLLFLTINSVLCYEQVKVTIEPDADGKPRKIFTAEELKEYDGSKVMILVILDSQSLSIKVFESNFKALLGR